ncbi:MAG: glycoside hydrolase family 16 protein [Muribaculaceae bacterium]|nr:glycoside hydrolase family 16 protein [Muribaculaceae bacterium]
MKKSILYSALAALTSFSAAADVNIQFETEDYGTLGVYDCWVGSPFRTGVLQGNFAVVDNPDTSVDDILGSAPNGSAKVLGAQRSRFGGNLFGVRVNLKEKFMLTTSNQYVHVMLHRPVSGRVALVALGKRTDRSDQTGDEEQLWVTSSTVVEADKWCDAVFPIKGNPTVEIHSLVIVPECESPHAADDDFIFYVDDIIVSDSGRQRASSEPYPINFNKKDQTLARSDRYTSSVSLSSPTYGAQTAEVGQNSTKLLYKYCTEVFRVKAGETVTPTINFTGSAMHAYVYLDRDNNGQFDANLASDGHSLTSTSELLAFSALSGGGTTYYNSKGSSVSSTNITLPTFTIPSDLAQGVYRLRYKIDWDNSDAGGNDNSSNLIHSNGGSITDVIVLVENGETLTINANQLNGDIATSDGTNLDNNTITFGQAYTIKMKPAPGFEYNGVKIRHGYNLDADSVNRYDNQQWRTETVLWNEFDSNDCYTIPASLVDGNIQLEGLFCKVGDRIELPEPDSEELADGNYYPINYSATDAMSRSDRNLTGLTLTSTSYGEQTISMNQNKIIYHNLTTGDQVFHARPGDSITPGVNWTGWKMYLYVYLDRSNNGLFTTDNVEADGHTITANSELITYSAKSGTDNNWYTAAGVSLGSEHPDTRECVAYKLPNSIKPGVYRMRYILDWDCTDPAGHPTNSNKLTDNGGAIVDVLLIIDDSTDVPVTATAENGTLSDTDGNSLTATAVATDLVVKFNPADSYTPSGLKLRAGYNLEGDSIYHNNPQWATHYYTADDVATGELTIPGALVYGGIELTGYFVNSSNKRTVTYNLCVDGEPIATKTALAQIGDAYSVTWDFETSPDYYELEAIEGNVVDGENIVNQNLTQLLPFEPSISYGAATWYNIRNGQDNAYLKHVSGQSYISLSSSDATTPSKTDETAQWCFVGDVYNGFAIYNRAAGSNMVLSSSTSITSSNDGNVFPIMTSLPVASGSNERWIPYKPTSTALSDGIWLAQKGFPSHKLNSRNSKLAYWIGGAGNGSELGLTPVEYFSGIDTIFGDESEYGPIEYYTLQGIRIDATQLTTGYYIARQGSKVVKVYIQK